MNAKLVNKYIKTLSRHPEYKANNNFKFPYINQEFLLAKTKAAEIGIPPDAPVSVNGSNIKDYQKYKDSDYIESKIGAVTKS